MGTAEQIAKMLRRTARQLGRAEAAVEIRDVRIESLERYIEAQAKKYGFEPMRLAPVTPYQESEEP